MRSRPGQAVLATCCASASEARTYKPGDSWDLARGCLHSESYGPEGAVVLFGRKI